MTENRTWGHNRPSSAGNGQPRITFSRKQRPLPRGSISCSFNDKLHSVYWIRNSNVVVFIRFTEMLPYFLIAKVTFWMQNTIWMMKTLLNLVSVLRLEKAVSSLCFGCIKGKGREKWGLHFMCVIVKIVCRSDYLKLDF